MSVHDEIDKAVFVLGVWKQKLRTAMYSAESGLTAKKRSAGNNFSFGKWLHERIETSEKESPYYVEILQLHTEFHLAAGEILSLALLGEKDKVNQLMGLSEEFSQKSSYLTKKMKMWQASF
ncbi:hypothetical protein A9Q82_08955 [Cycloclasticus sp. 46_120_T64]|nr:hypothetical protein A9Q82_08955 [Cycloclasticus sp. 46_120_T64]